MQVYTIGTGKLKHEIGVELTESEAKLHAKALMASRVYLDDEAHLCEVLREVIESSLFIKLGYSSLFSFAVNELGLSESVAGSMNTVARNCARVPELREAIRSQRLSVSKASRIVSSLRADNSAELIEFAATHTTKEIDREMARRNPERANRDRVRPVNESDFEIKARVSAAVHDLIKRAESIIASKGKSTKMDSLLKEALEVYLDRHDPVRRAERAVARKNKKFGMGRRGKDGKSDGHAARPRESNEARSQSDLRKRERGSDAKTSDGKMSDAKSSDGETSEAKGSKMACAAKAKSPDGRSSSRKSHTPESAEGMNANDLCLDRGGTASGHRREAQKSEVVGKKGQSSEAIVKEETVSQEPTPTPIQKTVHARAKLKAATRHEVILRAGGRCTFIDDRGERCNESRYLQTHHIVPLNQGGSDEPSNLTCLCPNHHALVHQLSFAIDGQITWLRTRQVAYRA